MFHSSGDPVYFLLVNSINIAISFILLHFCHYMQNGKYYFLGATFAILQNVTSSQQQTFIKLFYRFKGVFLLKIRRLLLFLETIVYKGMCL